MDNPRIHFKIMLAGSRKKTLRNLCNYVENLHMNALIAETGMEAIKVFGREHPDIVLIDENLADMEVSGLASKIRETEKNKDDTTIILVTHMKSDTDIMQSCNFGINDFIMQPISESAFRFQLISIQQNIKMREMLNDLNCKFKYASQLIQNHHDSNG